MASKYQRKNTIHVIPEKNLKMHKHQHVIQLPDIKSHKTQLPNKFRPTDFQLKKQCKKKNQTRKEKNIKKENKLKFR